MDILGKINIKKNITELALESFQWKLYSTISIVLMQLSIGVILARHLPPDVFGTFLYAVVIVDLISVYAQGGLREAIVQRQRLTKEHIQTGFTLCLLLNLSATIGLWIFAPVFTHDTGTSVLRIVSLSFFLSGVSAISSALLEKELQFRPLFWAEVLSYGIGQGVISINLAMLGFGVWSLVYGLLLCALIKSTVLLLVAPQAIGFSLERGAAKELIHFGFGRSLTRLANYGAQNGDYLVLGRLLPPQALGLYSRAFQVARIPSSYVASSISSVLFPVYAAVQDDNQRLRKGFYLSVSLVAFITFPLMAWLFIAGGKLITVVYGPAWTDSIHSLKILTVSGALASIYTLCDALARAKGLVYAQFRRHSIYATTVIVGAILGIGHGIEGVAIAVTLAVVVVYVLMAQLSISLVGGTWLEFLQAQIPGGVVGASVALLAYAILFFGDTYLLADPIILLMLSLSFVVIYPIVFVFLPISCFGEIPGFLLVRCSSLLPQKLLEYLNWRLRRIEVGIDSDEEIIKAPHNTSCSGGTSVGMKVHTRDGLFDSPLSGGVDEKLPGTYSTTQWFKLAKYSVFVRFVRRAYYELRTLIHVLQNSLTIFLIRRVTGIASVPVTQLPLSWKTETGRIRSVEHLKDLLIRDHLAFAEGGNTVYIPPQPRLERLLGKAVAFYPSDAGFKILKHFQPPEKASYVGHCSYDSQGDCYTRRVLTGSIWDQVDSANVLHMLELGPALYDVAAIIADETVMTCFIVQHVDGGGPTEEDHERFLTKLNNLINEGVFALVPPEGFKSIDFQSPDCNHNLIRSENGQLMYIDFQQFILRNKENLIKKITCKAKKNLHFGNSRLFQRHNYLHQSLPGRSFIGKRDSNKRWTHIKGLLHDSGIQVADRVVLDIGCNAGMMLSYALANGASWGLGWDRPDVVEEAKRLNAVLGNTRLNLYAAKLSEEYPILNDIPERLRPLLGESVIFYLAVWRHIGFMPELANLPWKALVFEGHEGDTWEDLNDQLLKIQSEWHCTLAVKSAITDGDCGTRPIGVMVRANRAWAPHRDTHLSHSCAVKL